MPRSKPEPVKRLPAGKHGLTPEQVASDQRRRILKALAEVMSAKGYSDTTITDIVTRARVSRPTFYGFFDSKQECFMAGYAHVQQRVSDEVLAGRTSGAPMERFETLLDRYLDGLTSDPATSRLYLVHIWEAGPEAVHRRLVMQQRFVDGVTVMFKARSKADRFACKALVAAIGSLVTYALLEDGEGAVLALREPVLQLTERLMAEQINRTR